MTEAEWLISVDPEEMRTALAILGIAGQRQFRLTGCASCRRLWKEMTDSRSRRAVEGAEQFADGLISSSSLAKLSQEANTAWEAMPYKMGQTNTAAGAAAMAAYISSEDVDINALSNTMGSATEAFPKKARVDLEKRSQAVLLRDIFGNPFHPVVVDPSWLTSTAVAIAHGIYDDKAFDRLPILADALQDAGCENADVLNHLRSDGPHVRGCWALDLVLGKE